MNELKKIITVIGQRRFVMLAALIAANVVLFLSLQNLFVPQNEQAVSQESRIKGELVSISREIQELPERHAALKVSDNKYVALMMRGLFADQDRIEARSRIDKIRGLSGLRGVEYKIEPQKLETNAAVTGINGEVMLTSVDVQIKSLTDLEMRTFIQRMHDEFSGLVIVKKIKFDRSNAVSDENLLRLTKKDPVDFVTGSVSFDWYSMKIKEGMPEAAAGRNVDPTMMMGPNGMDDM